MSQTEEPAAPPPVEVPIDALSSETLDEVIESFILREGTDYGKTEVSLETKLTQIKNQLKSGEIRLVFDPGTESVTLMTRLAWQKLQ